jgi:DNA-binding XRE family transcriptional regulator
MPRINSNRNTPKDERQLDTNYEPSPVDVHVGGRIRLLRISAGMGQEELCAALGVSHEKMREFESGATRIGPELLYDASINRNVSNCIFSLTRLIGSDSVAA